MFKIQQYTNQTEKTVTDYLDCTVQKLRKKYFPTKLERMYFE